MGTAAAKTAAKGAAAEKTRKPGRAKTFRNGLCWSTRAISYSVVNTLFVSYLSFYATDVLGMAATTIAAVLLITKVFDGFTDLVAGFIIDNTHTRWGKARPYDWCIPFIALFTVLAFSAPKASQPVQAVYIGAMYVLAQAVFYTLTGASDNVYLLRAFPKERERNDVFGISSVFSQLVGLTIGVFLPGMISAAGTSQAGWTRMVMLTTLPLAAVGMIRFFTIKEVVPDAGAGDQKAAKKEKVSFRDGMRAIFANRYILILSLAIFIIVVASGLLNTSAAYYFKYFVGDVGKMSVIGIASYASLIMLVLFVPLADRFGKDRVMKFGLVTALVGAIIRWVGGTNILTIAVGMGLLMFGIMPISVYFPLFLFDIIDYSEWKTGKRVEGVLAVFPSFANKVAAGISVSLGSFILGAAGYDGTASVQSASAMQAINLTFNILPSILLAIMVVIICVFYNIGRVMPTVHADLAKRHEAPGAKTEEAVLDAAQTEKDITDVNV